MKSAKTPFMLMLAALCSSSADAASQAPCELIRPPEEIAQLLTSSGWDDMRFRLPHPEEPIFVCIRDGYPLLVQAACEFGGSSIDGKAIVFVSPPPPMLAHDSIAGDIAMYAWHGSFPIGTYSDGDFVQWLHEVADGSAITIPRVPRATSLANLSEWTPFPTAVWSLISAGCYDRARSLLLEGWQATESNLIMSFIRYTSFIKMWDALLTADKVETSEMLETELKRRIETGVHVHPIVLRDIAELSKLLNQPAALAETIRGLPKGVHGMPDLLATIRFTAFGLLYDAAYYDELRIVIGPSIAGFLGERLELIKKFAASHGLSADDGKTAEALSRVASDCIGFVLRSGRKQELDEALTVIESALGLAGVADAIAGNATISCSDGCMQCLRSWCRKIVRVESIKSRLSAESRATLRRILEGG